MSSSSKLIIIKFFSSSNDTLQATLLFPFSSRMTSISEVLLKALKAEGATEVFGIPGDFALPFFKVIEETKILPLYTFSHEPAVGFAADASARFRSKISVAAITYGAGALNMVNAVAASYAEKCPVVVISGSPGEGESRAGLLLHHQAKTLDSQFEIYKEITCDQTRLVNAETAPQEIARVLASAKTMSRPVYIELPRDKVNVPCESVHPVAALETDPNALQNCVDEILTLLTSASSPVLMAGVEIKRYNLEKEVAELAHKLGIPVVTSFMGRGLLSNTKCNILGTYLGEAGTPIVKDLVENSDALLSFGVILSDTNFGVSEGRINLGKAVIIRNHTVTLGYHTYSEIYLKALIDGLLANAKPLKVKASKAIETKPEKHTGALRPSDIAQAVNSCLTKYGKHPIACDMGDCLFTALEIENTDLIAPGYYATMGYGVPAGIGLEIASKKRSIILVGDGAFQMTGFEIGNASKLGVKPIIVVFNNASWEMLRAFQPESKFNDLDTWNFAELANTLGGRGQLVTSRDQLLPAFKTAFEDETKFQLLDIRLQRGEMSNTLSQFSNSVIKLTK